MATTLCRPRLTDTKAMCSGPLVEPPVHGRPPTRAEDPPPVQQSVVVGAHTVPRLCQSLLCVGQVVHPHHNTQVSLLQGPRSSGTKLSIV
jgi:hypothetical protein